MRRLLPSRREDFIPSLFESGFETDLFDRFFKESHYPKVDIKEVENGYEMKMDVPGFSKEDVKVEYRDGYLDVEGTREENKETKEDDGHYIRKERSYGSFKRSFYVGDIDEARFTERSKTACCSCRCQKQAKKRRRKTAHKSSWNSGWFIGVVDCTAEAGFYGDGGAVFCFKINWHILSGTLNAGVIIFLYTGIGHIA